MCRANRAAPHPSHSDRCRARTHPRRCGRECRCADARHPSADRSEEHTSELQSQSNLVCRLLLEKKKNRKICPMPLLPVRRHTRPTYSTKHTWSYPDCSSHDSTHYQRRPTTRQGTAATECRYTT